MVAAIWPFMLVVLACSLPNAAANIFVGPISNDFGIAAGMIGGMRGFGGGAALLVGFLAAPVLDRVPRRWTVCIGLGLDHHRHGYEGVLCRQAAAFRVAPTRPSYVHVCV